MGPRLFGAGAAGIASARLSLAEARTDLGAGDITTVVTAESSSSWVTRVPEAAFLADDFTPRAFGKTDFPTCFLAADEALRGMRNSIGASDHEPKKKKKHIPAKAIYDEFNEVKKQLDGFKWAHDEMSES